MAGRPLLSEDSSIPERYTRPECAVRRRVLRETIDHLADCPAGDRYQSQALANLARWKNERSTPAKADSVLVLPGDWGVVTQQLTKQVGTCFAVLNMANAYVPGGAYVEGAIAQEENMYRRSDCHFHIAPPHYDAAHDRYFPAATRLLSAEDGVVYLDTEHPRVCLRGAEDRDAADLGYPWLDDDEIFPFFELKAAAQDLRKGSAFDAEKARRQIRAQLETLKRANVRHVVLGAFGCGAFRNPAAAVARIYREELSRYSIDLDVVAFAIFNAGYGPDNYTPFRDEFNTT
ncbi:MAG: DUF2263 domain-containing protein [Caldilineaceae bacterium]